MVRIRIQIQVANLFPVHRIRIHNTTVLIVGRYLRIPCTELHAKVETPQDVLGSEQEGCR
jgi:hypothetical protein